jgi:hypothetical protein
MSSEAEILEACKQAYIKISKILSEIKKEDVTEFVTTIQVVQVTINSLLKVKRKFSLDRLKELKEALEEHEKVLEELNQTEGKLIRFFSSGRLRKRIESSNSNIHAQLSKLKDTIQEVPVVVEKGVQDTKKEETIFGSFGEDEIENNIQLSLMIEDQQGKDLWAKLYGLDVIIIFC